jgi:PPOX class probable F420-dependent enzyme
MSRLSDSVQRHLAENTLGVLGTARPDGGVRQTPVYFVLDSDTILISTESKRYKAHDVERTGRASLCVTGHARPFPSVTLEGPARIRRTDIGEPTARIRERMTGEPAEPSTDEQLAQRDRVLIELEIEHVYGENYLADE